jgi:hypothetical protein
VRSENEEDKMVTRATYYTAVRVRLSLIASARAAAPSSPILLFSRLSKRQSES